MQVHAGASACRADEGAGCKHAQAGKEAHLLNLTMKALEGTRDGRVGVEWGVLVPRVVGGHDDVHALEELTSPAFCLLEVVQEVPEQPCGEM